MSGLLTRGLGVTSGATVTVYPTTPVSLYGLDTVYASDEDIALLAGNDFRALAPKWLRLAYGADGVLSGWVLTSASCDFGANEVVPGCVVSLTKSSANLTGDLFGVENVGTGYVTLRRLGKAAGVGQPPPAATGVEFEVRTFARQIDEASFDLNNVFGIDPDLPALNPVVLQRPRELRRLTALSVLRQAYTENWQDKGDDWAKKLDLVATQYDDLRARLVLHLQSTTGVPEPVRVIGMRIGR